jgi:hypothetical protein
MDTPMPTMADVLDELEKMTPDLRHSYVPSEMPTLVALWMTFLQLTEKVELVINTNYRIRRAPVRLSVLEQLDTEIWQCKRSYHSGLLALIASSISTSP